MNLQKQLSYGAYNPKSVKKSWILASDTLLFKIIEIWEKENQEKKPQKSIYMESTPLLQPTLCLHIHVSQQLNHVTETYQKRDIFKEM